MTFENSIIGLACWNAAKGEPHTAMLSVAMVFRNRANAGWYEKDVYLNATHWLLENPPDFPDTRDPKFQLLLSKLDAVVAGEVQDRTGGALDFVKKQDATEQIAGQIVMTISNMLFIR